jgi:Mg-chelatase subunit ChlD
MLVLDVTESMRGLDVAPTRIEALALAMARFVREAPHDVRVGVIEIGRTVRLVVDPAAGRQAALKAVYGLEPDGTIDLDQGFTAAVRLTLKLPGMTSARDQAGYLPALMLVASDGNSEGVIVSPLPAARRAAAAGLRVDGVVVGTPHGTVRFQFAGGPVQSVPVPSDPARIEAITSAAGGTTFRAPTAPCLAGLLDALARSLR